MTNLYLLNILQTKKQRLSVCDIVYFFSLFTFLSPIPPFLLHNYFALSLFANYCVDIEINLKTVTTKFIKTMLSNKRYHAELPSIRLLVIGDSGVGKTSLISRITQDISPSNLGWTQQANIDIMMHICGHKSYFIEFIDVSGLISSKMARSVYYKKIDGIILVFDTNNKKSYSNLKNWLKEYYSSSELNNNDMTKSKSSFFPEIIIGSKSNLKDTKSKIPIFIIGNKIDLHSDYKINHMLPTEFNCNKDFGFDFTFMSSLILLKYQRTSMSQLKKWINSIINKIEQLQNKHHLDINNKIKIESPSSIKDENHKYENKSLSNKKKSSSIISLRSKLFSFW